MTWLKTLFGALVPSPIYGWALLAVFLAGAGLAGTAAWKYKSYECQADKLAALQRAIEQANAIAEQDREVLQTYEAQATRTRTVFRNLTREVIRYVQSHPDPVQCLDADGLRLWRAANAGTAPAAQPDDTVPPAAPAEKRPVD